MGCYRRVQEKQVSEMISIFLLHSKSPFVLVYVLWNSTEVLSRRYKFRSQAYSEEFLFIFENGLSQLWKCIRAIFIKISLQNPSGETSGQIVLNLILRQEYGNSFFHTRDIYVFFNAKIESGTEWLITKVGQLSANWWEISVQLCTQG